MTQRIGEEAIEDLIGFVDDAIDQILAREDEAELFVWVRAEAPRRFPEDFACLPGEQAVRATVFEIAREIWNKVPLPGSGYRIRSIPKPEGNDRCPCGSGQKHKRCCGAASAEAGRAGGGGGRRIGGRRRHPYLSFMIATAAPLSLIPEALITLWRSEEELWSRLQKWLEERESEEVDGLIGAP